MELKLHSASGGGAVDVSETTFGRDFNESLVHQVVTAYLAGGRRGTKAQKTRAQVRGGGRKPWRQKGTGNARAGSIRSPLWRGGGRAFAASTRDHEQKVNRGMYRGAMRSILSELIRQDRLVLVEDLSLEAPKTKELAGKLKEMELADVLLCVEAYDEKLHLASRNLARVGYLDVDAVDPVSLIRFEKVLMTVAALRKLEERLA